MTGMVVRLMNEDKKNVPICLGLAMGSGMGISSGTAFGNMEIARGVVFGPALGMIFIIIYIHVKLNNRIDLRCT